MTLSRTSVRSFVLSLGLAFPAWTQTPAVPRQPSIARLADSVIVLTDGRRYEPGLYGLKLVYTLQATGGTPFFALLGVGCTQCDGLFAIYILRPGERIDWLKPLHGFAYPGRDFAMMSDTANAFRRQFFGHCLPNTPSAAVQFAHEQARDSSWVDSIRTLVPAPDSLIMRNYPRTDYLERQVLGLVRGGQCREWFGR
jgi:hypothetical protein